MLKQWRISGGGPKFFQFHAVFWKISQNHMLAPPGELAPPPRGNPGSATVKQRHFHKDSSEFVGFIFKILICMEIQNCTDLKSIKKQLKTHLLTVYVLTNCRKVYYNLLI